MHKKVKYIIAVSLILTAVSGVMPAKNFAMGLGPVKASASIDDIDDDDDEFEEDAYLEAIYLSDGDIDFSKDQLDYDVYVSKDISKITVEVKPGNDDDIVEINDTDVDEDNDYKKKVSLDEGKNVITIYVKSDDDDETYTLNVYRTDESATSNNSDNITTSTTGQQNFIVKDDEKKTNAWQRVGGKWKYVDATGQFLKNSWWFDKDASMNYYLDNDGYRTTGWFQNNNNWYYFNNNGEMQTGWICLDRNWYYLNKSGAMQMGWLEDASGNWYYLDNSGAMKTGWIENSDGNWYYFDSTGKMVKDSSVGGYQLDSSGVLIN